MVRWLVTCATEVGEFVSASSFKIVSDTFSHRARHVWTTFCLNKIIIYNCIVYLIGLSLCNINIV